MFISGTSTHKGGNVAEKFTGVAPSASTISRLNQTLTEQYEAWRERPLQAHYRILYLDGIYFEVRHGSQVDSTVILTALSVDFEGKKEVLARAGLCRGKQRRVDVLTPRYAHTWSDSVRYHRD